MPNESRFDASPTLERKRQRKLNPLPNNQEEGKKRGVVATGRFPSWLHRKLPRGNNLLKTGRVLEGQRLHTVCEEAKCPNLLECWTKKTATFLVMGKACTRACGFCDIDFNKAPPPLEDDEPARVAQSVASLGLNHVVITMVTRDDLPDGGAHHVRKIIEKVREARPEVTIEVLTSDFQGNPEALDQIVAARPEIFNHNIETVRHLTPKVRHKATYDRTLEVLSYFKNKTSGIFIKSGIMVGLGEDCSHVEETIRDLKAVGCDIVTIGQYLQPNRNKLRVKEFVHPDTFEAYAQYGDSVGIKHMYCGPFVRSSYNASDVLKQCQGEQVA